MAKILNGEIAQRLREVAQLLHEQGANPYRVHAYRRAAETLERLDRPVTEVLETEGMDGLRKLPGIGESLARSIHDVVKMGRLPMLDRLRGEADPVTLLESVPGIGEALAKRLHHDLGIDTLEELEAAAHDGRLTEIAGIGEKKLTGIIDSLASRLGRVRERSVGLGSERTASEPSVGEILDVDREYREKAAAGELHKIAPRRLNPSGEAWLPVLHTQRGRRHYTVLFSNTARAHELGKTHDWVILYYDAGNGERQCTVITAQRAPLKDKRIVRGREAECVAYYQTQEAKKNINRKNKKMAVL
ncbi:MAG: helix-hairpin-helix domain-containing protein [Nitrospirota bacterium]